VLDARTGELLGSYLGHAGPTYGIATIPGTDLAVTAGWLDETVHVWDASPGPVAEVRRRDLGPGLGRFAQTKVPDRIMLTGRSADDPNLVADAETFEPILDYPGNDDVLTFRPFGDGSVFAVTAADGHSDLIDVATGRVVYTAPRGYTIAEVSGDRRVVLLVPVGSVADPPEWPATFDRQTGALTPLEGTHNVGIPVFSLDGSLLFAAVHDGAVIDTATGTRIFDSTDLTSIRPMPDGVMATIATVDNELMLVPIVGLGETAAFSDIAEWTTSAADATVFPLMHQVNDSGTLIMTSPRGEPVRVWDARDGTQVAELYPNRTEGAAYGAFDPFNPEYVTVMADRGILLTYTLDVDELIDIARSRLTRNLTDEECATFLHLPAGCPTG
jgi:WD40 repeat protein